ncbi:hypothetical protein KAR91_19025, partial [Candidatus Pacearchaeota archaeon]|nr:hypothetical protein [Candidatus Pacearchaeota archaeon]
DGTIDAADMADEDHGDVSWTSGVATVEGGQADSAYHSDSTNLIHINVRNNSGGSLTKGSPVKNNGFNVGTGEILVILASASSSDSMPAIGILDQTLSNNSSGTATVSGVFAGTASSNFKTDSAGWADKDGIYVGAGQVGLTDARPTNGATVQKLGEITRTHATLGSINVSGAGRTNDIPNMASAGFFIGGPDSVGVVQIISGEGTIDSTGVLTIADDAIDSTNILDGSIFESDLDVSNTPTDNYILSYNDAGKNFTWVAGGAGESNTLSDTGTFDDVSGFGLVTAKVGVDLRMRGLIEGSNITITQSGDTGLIVTGAAGGSGTTDSSYINDGTEYGPFTNDMFKIKESTGIDITREDSTTYDVFQFAATLGTSIDSSEIEANQVGESELDLGTGAQQIGIVDMAGTAWRVFYTNGSGVMTELALGADGTYLESNGAAAAPTFTTPAGSGTGHWDSLGTDSLFWIDADVDTNMIIYDDDAGTVTWAIDVNQSFLKIGTANADSVQIGPAGLTRADSLKILGQFRLVFGGDTAWWSTADAGTDGQVLHIDRTNDSMYWDDDDGAIDSTWESIRVDSARIDTLTSDTITTTDLAVTNLLISGDQITDLNGVGLKVVSTVLAVDTAAAVADAEPLPVSGNAVYDYVLANYATPSMVGDTADILRAEMPDSITTLNLFPQFSRTYFDTTLAGDDSLQVIFADSSGATDTTNATLTTYVENLAGDSLAEYSTLIGQITDDTTSWKNAADTVAAWDNAALDSNNFKDAGISLPEDLNTFTEAELETALSDVTALFTNNVTGDVTVSGGTSTLGANTVDSTHVVANALSIPSDLAQATKAELEGRMSDVSDFAEADGDTWTGTHDFGGATALEIPNGVNPNITNEGELAWDTDDDAFEVTDGTNDMLLTVKKIVSPLIWNPDLITDTVPILYIDSLVYPGGIEIIRAEVQTSEDGAYALKLMYFTAADPPVFSEWIDTLNVGASDQRFASNTFDNSAIAVGQIIYMLTPATDIDWIRWSLTFYVKENN